MSIAEIAKHLGITAAQLAEMAGVSRQELNDYTRGRRGKPSEFAANVLEVADGYEKPSRWRWKKS